VANGGFSLYLGDTDPANLPASELARIITAVEDAVKAAAAGVGASAHELGLIVALIGIHHSDTGLAFRCSDPDVGDEAADIVTGAIVTRQTDHLPEPSRRGVGELEEIAARRNICIEWRRENKVLATIRPSPHAEQTEPAIIGGETSVFGRIEGVGGKTPRIVLRTHEGQRVSCLASEALAKEAAARLYEWAVVLGSAEWDAGTGERRPNTFRAERISAYRGSSWVEAFHRIRELTAEAEQE